jgi:hypothetical protein
MKKVAAARQKADEARQASSASALATAVGAGIAATSDSRMGQHAWAGGALMAGSTSSELQLKAEELSALQKSVWGSDLRLPHSLSVWPNGGGPERPSARPG